MASVEQAEVYSCSSSNRAYWRHRGSINASFHALKLAPTGEMRKRRTNGVETVPSRCIPSTHEQILKRRGSIHLRTFADELTQEIEGPSFHVTWSVIAC